MIKKVQITKVGIKNLYGLHHYEITFDEEACIKIIHAPNGYGKTTLLKLIYYVMYYRIDELLQISFTKFQIIFDQNISVEVIKHYDQTVQEIEYIIVEEEQIGHYKCFASKRPIEQGIVKELEEKLEALRIEIPIHLIRANRLLQEGDCQGEMMPSVLRYAKELKSLMKNALASSAKINEELDRNFPKRLLQVVTQEKREKNLSYVKINNELKVLEDKRRELEQIGLLLTSASQVVEITESTPDYILETLTLYVEESKKKLSVFDDLAPRMKLMQELINKRFAYKKMCLNQEEGFTFEVPYNGRLHADRLSSGEQNELILIFELLFKSKVNALILIDEPEISLHIAWQQSFLEDMEKIAALTGVKLIIATHSPDIINGRWDLTTGLEEC